MKKIIVALLTMVSISAIANDRSIPCNVWLELNVVADHGRIAYAGATEMSKKLRNQMYDILDSKGYKLVSEVLPDGSLADRLEISTTTYVNDPKFTITEIKIKNIQNVPGSFFGRSVLRDDLIGSVTNREVFGKYSRQGANKKIWNEMVRAMTEALPHCTNE